MDTVKINHGRVRMIAHRGVSGLEKENTCPAFVAAANRSYYGIETDVHITSDGVFVIIHDDDTERITDGEVNVNVDENEYALIKDIILPDRDGSTYRKDIRIPTLEEYIAICRKYDKKAVLELKNHFEPKDIERMVGIIRDMDYLAGMVFISFDWENCIVLRRLLPMADIQWLYNGEISDEIIDRLEENKLDFDVGYPRLTKEILDKLHSKGIVVNCWTVDDKETAEKLVEMGVDYITSNILE